MHSIQISYGGTHIITVKLTTVLSLEAVLPKCG